MLCLDLATRKLEFEFKMIDSSHFSYHFVSFVDMLSRTVFFTLCCSEYSKFEKQQMRNTLNRGLKAKSIGVYKVKPIA